MVARSLLKSPSPGGALHAPARRRWWTEIVVIAAFYVVYTVIRDWRGTHPVSAELAFDHARTVIALERWLGLFHEAQIQKVVMTQRWVVWALDDWYGTAHFLVTATVLIVLFARRPKQFARWRNTLAVLTALALVGFAVFPLMPPRLLPASYGFTDTLRVVGGAWNFDSGPMPHLSDQFAAMPSLHFAWALWSGAALYAAFHRPWLRVAAVLYPVVTLVCVIVTANHFFTDTVAGAVIVVIGYGAARVVESTRRPATEPVAAATGGFDRLTTEPAPGTVDPVPAGRRSGGDDGA